MSGFTDIVGMAWERQRREEDMIQRRLENKRREIEDARRLIDEKANQLKCVANQSALIAGFSMIVLVEGSKDNVGQGGVLILFGIVSSLVVGLMLTSMLNSTFVLVAISRYDTVDRQVSFHDFWRTRCEDDWLVALTCFVTGVPLFMVVLLLVGWISFPRPPLAEPCKAENAMTLTQYRIVSIFISFVATVVLVYFLMHTCTKWYSWLKASDPTLQVIESDEDTLEEVTDLPTHVPSNT